MLKKGDIFPQFNLENQNGEVISNETIKGNKTVLYFYPRDNTPTCTTEACDFRDNLASFNELGVNVFGISGDSKKKHQNFIEKLGLNFDLLVDEDYQLSKATGVYQLKKSFGKESMGIVRTTFILDEEGKVIDVIEKVKVKTQMETLKNILG
ncbi:thioredoxin-dependent thiol peroxidase [Staphylococcus gallinarum]|jgi:peroxiredoxin Q/BCP|uniref:thioredoxin-dependent thiol peroxidase n=1 Tax=Staphylococcus gallinarum TaxID=1293 RepID=UPI000D1C543F|nr:thioredoxin-dependent thiol peroxidase [Staphylococcus gallinarum]MBU7217416.1 thioredoxin-dependent thiol peroxidase [Staphylococcus gallinarum]MCD8786980.1 thioredoxin-dependent thiol peroxidase [Staphylococcus gallinarum]MCD8794100.1 thioredoxin-dependent thiol peroxidase [Staphylococcus gallinarum]MCD8844937.1 thioredoxin-dependent thiol peroxidase [Staphylococcus gallinarum]MCD8859945.1 thioredoxin-dependent thiol peroxidase [Staphylococcus gallinarum]